MTDSSIQATPPPPAPVMASFQGVLRFTLIFGILHAVLWCVCIGLLLLYVPPAERTFRDWNMTLPAATKFVLDCAHWVADYFMLLPFLLAFWLLVEVPLLGILRHQSRGRGWAWGLLHTLLPLLFAALIFYAIHVPLVKVLEGLSR